MKLREYKYFIKRKKGIVWILRIPKFGLSIGTLLHPSKHCDAACTQHILLRCFDSLSRVLKLCRTKANYCRIFVRHIWVSTKCNVFGIRSVRFLFLMSWNHFRGHYDFVSWSLLGLRFELVTEKILPRISGTPDIDIGHGHRMKAIHPHLHNRQFSFLVEML